jgi:hypothetical protein
MHKDVSTVLRSVQTNPQCDSVMPLVICIIISFLLRLTLADDGLLFVYNCHTDMQEVRTLLYHLGFPGYCSNSVFLQHFTAFFRLR